MMIFTLNKYMDKLIDLNFFIHKDYDRIDYHIQHIRLTRLFLIELNKRLGFGYNNTTLTWIGLCHDLLKEHGLDKTKQVEYKGKEIPQDINRYVRMNLDVLEEFGLEDYFSSDVQYHALAAGIFLYKEMNVKNPEILYPIMFHSCPIMDVYLTLDKRIQTLVDMTMLADKLSSNWLRINMLDKEVCCDLTYYTFGESGRELNYTLGLYLARLISQGKSDGEQSKITTKYYYDKLCRTNPLIAKHCELGGKQEWPKRSLPWKIVL